MPQNVTTFVIIGTKYWEYGLDIQTSDLRLKSQFPRLLSTIGVPGEIEIMAALTVEDQGLIFLFSNDSYWVFDGYLNIFVTVPRVPINEGFPGIPNGINAAFQWQGK